MNTTEFTHLRYTAATCDPDDFTAANGYSMRTHTQSRHTELLIAITSFNEDAAMYARTLKGVLSNIHDLCTSQRSRYWRGCAEDGDPAWQRITVALVVDGLDEMDDGALDFLAGMGVYQHGVMKRQVDMRDAVAHVFESVISSKQLEGHADDPVTAWDAVPVQFILIIKAENQKKINSHRWIFNAVGKMLEPEVCILVDAGTKPGPQSIYYLWDAFHNDENLGGSCGEIHTMGGKLLLNPLVAAQNFEYKMSNILDKPLESTFGYVSVLPGAFSAYRYRAILGRPLEQYFKGDHSMALRLGNQGMNGMSIFQKNMFLAEDRILCFELIAKKGERWTLSYVKASKAETDVPESAAELIVQRRRWLNGSFAATVYALVNFGRVYQSSHGFGRMALFHVQVVYSAISLFFSWFALANVWLTFSILLDMMSVHGVVQNVSFFHWLSTMLKYVYLSLLVMQFVLALGNRPKSERIAYTVTFWVYALLAMYLCVCSIWFAGVSSFPASAQASEPGSFPLSSPLSSLLYAMCSTLGIYVFASVLYLDPWHLFHSSVQYLCLAPSFINVLNVYAFCNLHDVSWGTKGSNRVQTLPSVRSKSKSAVVSDRDMCISDRVQQKSDAEDVQRTAAVEDENRTFRTRLVAFWLFSNAVLAFAVNNLGGAWLDLNDPLVTLEKIQSFQRRTMEARGGYISFLLFMTFALAFVRFIGCLVYWGKTNVLHCCRRN
ncbi:chitin synthase-domain-containing protein [Crassisporium funariophilum]|nr:chitin synthase-domain-containing protein [Crassisporium funariophilum]